MPHDDTLTRLLTNSATRATQDIAAPEGWATSIPAQAAQRRRRITAGAGALATLATAAVAVAVIAPQSGSEREPATKLAAFMLSTSSPASRAAAEHLTCVTATAPTPPGSTSALSVGRTKADGSTCALLQGRRDTALPSDANPVPGHDGLYFGSRTDGYRLGYRTFPDAAADPVVLQVAVGSTVSDHDLLAILTSIEIVP